MDNETVLSIEPELARPVEILEPPALLHPVVLSSPHSGPLYPAQFLRETRLSPLELRRSEDAHVDRLFMPAIAMGAPMARAIFPRAYLDVNREPYELDPRMFDGRLPSHANTYSLRVAAGLGTVPRVVADSQEIYAARLPVSAAMNRIESLYRPYHNALRRLMRRAHLHFGVAILIDCHSMPSRILQAGRTSQVGFDVVLGDRFGMSCAPIVTDAAERAFKAAGLSVARNKPYAGGFITEHYGAPATGAHALQIEINRALYMNESNLEPSPGFAAIAQIATDCVTAIVQASQALIDRSLAAE